MPKRARLRLQRLRRLAREASMHRLWTAYGPEIGNAKRITLLHLAIFVPTFAQAQSCDCEVSDPTEAQYDQLLILTSAEKAQAEATHLPWGIPTAPTANEHLIHQHEWITNYDNDLRVPTWVAYHLTAADVVSRTRQDCFRRDPRLITSVAAFCEDYEERTYDRGHMVPRADMNRTEAAMVNTYVFSNMVPQHNRFNQQIWSTLEGFVRDWATVKGEIYVISGAIFDRDESGERDPDDLVNRLPFRGRVAVPSHFYKIIIHERADGFMETMAIVLRHHDWSPPGDQREGYLTARLTSIDQIEELTGIDFLPGLGQINPRKEFAVERSVAASLWPRQ